MGQGFESAAIKTSKHGFSFDSKLEAALYEQLWLLEKCGEISGLKVKPNVFLTRASIRMIPDFCANENGVLVYFEAKGIETDVWRIKRKLWKYYGPGPLRVFKGSHKSLYQHEEIIPKPSFDNDPLL